MDYTVQGILQARILEWVAFPFSRGSSQRRDGTQVSRTAADSLPAEPPGMPGAPITKEGNEEILHLVAVSFNNSTRTSSDGHLLTRPVQFSSVVSDSLRPHGWLLCPWESPGKNSGVGCHFLLQGIFPTQGLNPGLPHCTQRRYHLSHQGSPDIYLVSVK